MKKSLAISMLAASALLASASFSTTHASTITFGPTGWVYNDTATVPWVVAIDDLTVGQYRVKVSIFDTQIADIFALGFDSDLTGLTISSVTDVSSATGDTISGFFGTGTNAQETCGSGCNFNGIGQAFGYIVSLGDPGASSGFNTTWEFLIAHPALSVLSSFTQVGIRAQSIGPRSLSAKDYHGSPVYAPPVGEVPIPAALPLFAAGIGAMGFIGWRRKRKALA